MWFVFLVGMVLYLGLCDIENFRKYMYFIIISYSVTVVIYLVYPTYQDLRPTIFERDNIFVHIVQFLYGFDTNTNVCPSIHVLFYGRVACKRNAKNRLENILGHFAYSCLHFDGVLKAALDNRRNRGCGTFFCHIYNCLQNKNFRKEKREGIKNV